LADDLLSLREAAARTGLSASHLRLLARSGKVEAHRIGSYWVTTEAAVVAYLANEALRAKDPWKRRRSG
jgi:excisionase family DNA binding protein